MSWQIVEGDCIEAMAAMPEASVDAVVCDPPYGLEFMGKTWDRLGDVGQASHQGIAERDGSSVYGRAGRVDYSASANLRCQRCGHWRYSGSPCECGPLAVWPNVKAVEGRRMQEWHEAWAREALRVLKPGGHLLAFGGTRTYHRLTCAIEDAGFEIRDCLAWLYGSGFPKSLDVSKAIDKAAGAEREIVGDKLDRPGYHLSEPGKDDGVLGNGHGLHVDPEARSRAAQITAPATPDAERWQGWGTALKPAHEPIVLARKPLAETVAGNVLAHGTGALNVDGCRIEGERGTGHWGGAQHTKIRQHGRGGTYAAPNDGFETEQNASGRWPANVLLDPEAAAMLDEQTGEIPPSFRTARTTDPEGATWSLGRTDQASFGHHDSGGASRFFYCAKASSGERNAGLDSKICGCHDLAAPATSPPRAISALTETAGSSSSTSTNGSGSTDPCPTATSFTTSTESSESSSARETCADCGGVIGGAERNPHPLGPTVKPIDLMRWLVRLVTPPGGTVLDPFVGSGTTGCAAVLEGFSFVGIERDPDYVPIARARIAWWERHPEGMALVERLEAERARAAVAASGQVSLFDLSQPEPVEVAENGRDGEASAERRYTDRGASSFAMKPGRRRP